MSAVREVVERVYRDEAGRITATLIRVCRDFDVAEDAVQEAFARALSNWTADGVPRNPAAWVMATARNSLIDRLRREQTRKSISLSDPAGIDAQPANRADEIELLHERLDCPIEDDCLRLIFTCCHPALNQEAQIALTLRTLGGLTTAEIARAFLVPVSVIAQRIVRAKQKIKEALIPYEVPSEAMLPSRLAAVMAVLYLIFNEGYSASADTALTRPDLSHEAIRLARFLARLMPNEPEVLGLLGLMLLHDSRRAARTSPTGEVVLLENQDRSRWDAALIDEGRKCVEKALRMNRPGEYQVQAAIAAVHADAPNAGDTDWPQVVALYDVLMRLNPSPVIALNRAVAVAFASGPEAGLRLIEDLVETRSLANYLYLHSSRADLLRRLERWEEAASAYERALALPTNEAERRYLSQRQAECNGEMSRRREEQLHYSSYSQ
jgi:RNA polymerase sigma-70 factor (ECF subfamily)